MNHRGQLLIVTLLFVVAGCIPVPYMDWKEVPVNQKGLTDKKLIIGPGDRVRIHATNMNLYILKVTRTDDRGFYGTARDDKEYRMQYDDIAELEVMRGDVAMVPLSAGGPIPMSGGGVMGR